MIQFWMYMRRKSRVLWTKFRSTAGVVLGYEAYELSLGYDRDSASAGGMERRRMAASVGSRSRGRPWSIYCTPSTYEVRSKDGL